jgi:hypothetical protein
MYMARLGHPINSTVQHDARTCGKFNLVFDNLGKQRYCNLGVEFIFQMCKLIDNLVYTVFSN